MYHSIKNRRYELLFRLLTFSRPIQFGWSSMESITRAQEAQERARQEKESLVGVLCSCSNKALMSRGCVCGAMARERARA